MKRLVKVFIGETPRSVGLIRYAVDGSRERAAFEYDNSWLTSPDSFSIEPALRLVAGPQFHRKSKEGSPFHGAIADTEPDGWGRRVILRDHTKRRQEQRLANPELKIEPLTDLDFLLAVDDFSRIGSLRFKDESGTFQRTHEAGRRTAPPLLELGMLLSASKAVESNTETAADLKYLMGRGTSLGGLRPKCTIIDDDGSLSIGKFPSITDERAVTKAEVLALQLASFAGINAATARVVSSEGTPISLVRRFDRSKTGGRLMYISAATMLGAVATDPHEHAYTEFVDALRVSGASAQEDIEELWRRIAFSILITNTDDHLLNHGFLHVERGKWRLAPAFDINPFPDRIRELKTWISEDSGPQATISSLVSISSYFQLSIDRAKQILKEVDQAVGRWHEQGRKLGMTSGELAQYADAFEHEERNAAKVFIS